MQAINLIASIVGVSVVHSGEDEDPMHALNKGYYVTSLLALVGFAVAIYFMLGARWWLLGSGICGIVTSFLFVRITEYYTETRFRPVQSIAQASLTGPATNIIQGLAVGMETPALPVIVISAALLLSYYFGIRGLADVTTISSYAKGIYGTAIATMGMLSSAAYILAMDTFGPITDNAGGIIEMSDQPHSVRDEDRQARCGGQYDQGSDQGLCDRIGVAGGVSAVLGVSGDDSRHRPPAGDGGGWNSARRLDLLECESGLRAGIRGRAAGGDAHVSLLVDGHQGCGTRCADRDPGCA